MSRLDLLTTVHKGIRAMIYETGGALQTADFADEQAAGRAADRMQPFLGLLQEHHHNEEQFLFPPVKQFEPQLVDELEAQHHEVERLLEIVSGALDGARAADAGARLGAGADLNRRFNELTAVFLEHLAYEEATLIPATWKHFTDEELGAIEESVVASMPPESLMQVVEWMFKGLNRTELVEILGDAEATMPPPALDAVKALGAEILAPDVWEAVRTQVGL